MPSLTAKKKSSGRGQIWKTRWKENRNLLGEYIQEKNGKKLSDVLYFMENQSMKLLEDIDSDKKITQEKNKALVTS